MPQIIYQKQNVADIYINASLKAGRILQVGGHPLPVAIKSQTNQLSLLVEYRAATVST